MDLRSKRVFWIGFVLFVVLGFLSAAVYDRATAVGGSAGAGQCAASSPELSCHTPAQLSSKFRHGKIRRTDGMAVRALFKRPAIAKRVIVHRTVRYLRHHRAKIPAVKRVVARYHAHVTSRGFGWITDCHLVCLSLWSYARAREKDNCAGDFLHNTVVGLCTPSTHPMTKKELQIGVTVTVCTGMVTWGVVAAGPTAGSGTVAAGAAMGEFGCGWGLFTSLSPG